MGSAVLCQESSGSVDTLLACQDQIILASKFVIPESIEIQLDEGHNLPATLYQIDQDTLTISLEELPYCDVMRLQYRYLDAMFFEDTKLLDSTLIAKEPAAYYDLSADENNNFVARNDSREINYSGSFARGFSIGNRQDLILSSDLDLQLSGKIGGEIDILAAISDQNIPLEPEGNTQNLREFDKVFIQLSKDKHRLLIGDYEVQSDSSHFLNFFKKWQGLKYDDAFSFDNGGTLITSASTAISRGKYNRNTIAIQEGNQGPYRLTGADGENFIIVIAATERVYIDGVLLTRGVERDYVIDYNTAEITFTPNLLITKDVRITIDFEYNDQSYLRTGSLVKSDFRTNKTRIYGSYYLEQDSRNTGANSGIGPQQKQQLALLGDNFAGASGSSIQPLLDEDLTPITYRLIDTMVNQTKYDSVLVFSTSDELNLFTARFSFVGDNGGNYILIPGSSNGSTYRWVAPIDGIPQGNYIPSIQLSAPEKTSMLSLGLTHQINNNWSIASELATSNQDLNRFSDLDNKNNRGYSMLHNIQYKPNLDTTKYHIEAGLTYEFVNKNFATINPFRNAEFSRDWNLEIGAEDEQQHLANGYFKISKQEKMSLELRSEFLDNITGVRGYKQSANLVLKHKGFNALLTPSFLRSSTKNEQGTFIRPNFNIYQSIGNSGFKLGVVSLIEHNERRSNTDSLSALSFSFARYEAYLENSTTKKLYSRIALARRVDRLPNEDELDLATTAQELNIKGHWNATSAQQLNWNFIARNLVVNNAELIDEVDFQTYLGKLSYSFQLLKGVIRSTTAYELGSGQENRVSFIYLEVEPGKGIYQWVDYNGDGVQQLEEFEVAPNIDQATYVRIERPTNDFIQTQNVLFNANLQLGLKPLWFNEKGIKKFVSKFSTSTNIQINRKNNGDANFKFWNPFDLSFDSDGIVSAQSLVRNNVYYDRGSSKFAAFIGRSNIFAAQVLDIGSLRTRQIDNYLNYQIKITESINHTFDYIRGTSLNDASTFQNRNFNIDKTRINPAIHFLFNKILNATIQYGRETQNNLIGSGEELTKNELNFSLGYQNSNARSIDLSLTYSNVDFRGSQNTPVAFTILDGLQNGRNLEWQLNMNQQIAKNLQLLINYNGRKTGDLNVIHFGNIQVKATF